jgi:predicted nucleic acid-binding protein
LASGAIYAGKDDKFIEAAVAGEATVIVSGDQHLLNLSTYGAIRIIPAREFLHQLEMHSAQGPESSGH